MPKKSFSSLGDQVVEHLRESMRMGRWQETLPGRERLAEELGCSHGTVETALRQLVREGWLVSQGAGRPRRIEIPKGHAAAPSLTVRLLLYDGDSQYEHDVMVLINQLNEAGISTEIANKTLRDLGMSAGRVARFVGHNPSDAWLVLAGSKEVLEWFSNQPFPSLAMYGRFTDLPIAAAGRNNEQSMTAYVKRLVELGHQRIVLLTNKERRVPTLGLGERIFLGALKAHGLQVGSYNLPDWEESPSGLRIGLDRLFRHTPPTAIICQESSLFVATLQYLSLRGLAAPKDISLIYDSRYMPAFALCDPPISKTHSDFAPLVRRIVRWARNVARGKTDIAQTRFQSEFIEGGTIGPAPQER